MSETTAPAANNTENVDLEPTKKQILNFKDYVKKKKEEEQQNV